MHTFSGGGTNFLLGIFPRGNFPWGGKFPGSELVRRNHTLRKFSRILVQKSFYVSCFLFFVSILRAEWIRVIFRGTFSPRLICLYDISMVRGFLHGDGVRFPWHYLKNDQKLNEKKQVFSTESKERH